MRTFSILALAASAALLSLVFAPASGQLEMQATAPPVALRIPHQTTAAGYVRHDDYFWLRGKDKAEVQQYLQAEKAYTAAVMKPTEPLQRQLYSEMLSHIKQTDLAVPYKLGAYYYYSRTQAGKQYPIYARRRGSMQAREQITLDLNALAAGRKFLALGSYVVSDDGNLLAYSLDNTGYRQYTLYIKDLRTGAVLPERLERVDDVVWASDNKTLFYVTEDPVSKRNDKFFRHKLGTGSYDLVYREQDELYDIAVERTRDRAMILLDAGSKSTTEVSYIPSDRPTDPLKVILQRSADHRYSVDHRGDLFYIVTNKGALDNRLVTAPVTDPQEHNWRVLIPERTGVHIDGVDMFARYAVISERSGGFTNFEVLHLEDGSLEPITLREAAHAVSGSQNPEFGQTLFRYTYQSLLTPSTVYDFDMSSGKQYALKATQVPGYKSAEYTSEQVFATASDGTKIPISIVYRKGVKLDGSAPMVLYGYGSYGVPIDPTFSASRLALLDRGVIYAIAHIRGGGEMGERWRISGHLADKLNTFTDFIDSAQFLESNKYTSKDRMAIMGGSAGGLLMGAVVNMRPDLFKAVVASVPFVDVMNTMLDPTLPLTTSEYLEWGNPNTKADYEYMMRYSPYDNVKAQAYPALLVRVSLYDSQVPYWEGTKFVAKLRALKTDTNPLLLEVNFGAGHGGASGRYDALKEIAFNYAFILSELGVQKTHK
ncbi:MAG: S9 family peptidase [Candidatus Eremiobacteraeota bacterium]|nr:S9 family peptidase [Candidatus Eremiobacteraeota bacterium]